MKKSPSPKKLSSRRFAGREMVKMVPLIGLEPPTPSTGLRQGFSVEHPVSQVFATRASSGKLYRRI